MPRSRIPWRLSPRVLAAFLALALVPPLTNVPALADHAGPVVSFGGKRFAVSRGFEAFESIAFDPGNKRVASRGSIRDQCGNRLSDGPDESPGLAWDLFTGYYWQITNDRTVRRWLGAALVDTAFVIPQIFNVPGSGPDTLESVRGIAVDQNNVYIVDAGPNSGEIESNEWFKFTRLGAPVKSSKSTALKSHLQMNPDCLFDDILYLPANSVVYPGRFLIPLEHTGFVIVDNEGNFLDDFYWSDHPLYATIAPFAFTGMAVDPAAGTFYLVDNDGGSSQIWTMLVESSPTSYIVGAGGVQGYLQRPVPGCNLPLWKDFPPPNQTAPGLLFGLAYRPTDQKVYGYEFNDGTLWKFGPLDGQATLVDATGPMSVWGLAYDTQRDVLYASQEVINGNQIHSVNPVNGNTTMLPSPVGFYLNDIAFEPATGNIYGVSSEGQLIRINRDTGAGTVVGSTQWVRGLDYDPATARLIGMANGPGRLYSIHPATGAATLLTNLANDVGWEGLAVVTLPAAAVDVADGAPPVVRPRLVAMPNPASGAVRLVIDSEEATDADISAFDASGRLVRKIHTGPIGAGPQAFVWDGTDAAGRTLPAGVYWFRVRAGMKVASARVVWLP